MFICGCLNPYTSFRSTHTLGKVIKVNLCTVRIYFPSLVSRSKRERNIGFNWPLSISVPSSQPHTLSLSPISLLRYHINLTTILTASNSSLLCIKENLSIPPNYTSSFASSSLSLDRGVGIRRANIGQTSQLHKSQNSQNSQICHILSPNKWIYSALEQATRKTLLVASHWTLILYRVNGIQNIRYSLAKIVYPVIFLREIYILMFSN